MLDMFNIRNQAMPSEMKLLLEEYPRDAWHAHAGFKQKTRNWLAAHQMFRKLAKLIRTDNENFLDKHISAEDYTHRLSYYGNILVGNLQGHHGWEDHSYFPELSLADPRFDAGLGLLEKDHADLDMVLEAFTNKALTIIRLKPQNHKQLREQVAKLHSISKIIETFLKRHLTDEEDLAIPIILHHRLRG